MAMYIVDGVCSYTELPPSEISRLNRKIDTVNNRVTSLTPYTVSKSAYIGDTECVFDKAKEGMVNVSVVCDGFEIPHELEISRDKVVVMFEPLERVATVTMMIQ